MAQPKKSPQQAPRQEPAKAQAELAGAGVRLMAVVYDGLLLFAIYAVLSAVLIPLGTPADAAKHHEVTVLPEWYRQYVLFPSYVLVTWLFYGYFWRKIGQTLGMQTWRLRVQRPDGSLLTWGDSLLRCVAAMLFPLFCGLASQLVNGSNGAFVLSVLLGFLINYFWIYLSPRRLAWHDLVSRTVVLRLPPPPKDKKRKFLGWFEEKND